MLKGASEEIIETTKLTETTNTVIDPYYDNILNRTKNTSLIIKRLN